jgi:hypothetical protein
MRSFLFVISTIFINSLLMKSASSVALSSYNVRSVSKVNWEIVGKNDINKGCKYDTTGKCTGYCPFTMRQCEELINFDEKVCGCQSCRFNATTKSCNGQCGNLLFDTCVSKTAIPTRDQDCLCPSCRSKWVIIDSEVLPSCDSSTCNGNSCEPVFVTVDGRTRVNDVLHCNCLNNNFAPDIAH